MKERFCFPRCQKHLFKFRKTYPCIVMPLGSFRRNRPCLGRAKRRNSGAIWLTYMLYISRWARQQDDHLLSAIALHNLVMSL
eukprot:9501908-Pyramimonas_sp.AAC.1